MCFQDFIVIERAVLHFERNSSCTYARISLGHEYNCWIVGCMKVQLEEIIPNCFSKLVAPVFTLIGIWIHSPSTLGIVKLFHFCLLNGRKMIIS